jgi:hypothetical protein
MLYKDIINNIKFIFDLRVRAARRAKSGVTLGRSAPHAQDYACLEGRLKTTSSSEVCLMMPEWVNYRNPR